MKGFPKAVLPLVLLLAACAPAAPTPNATETGAALTQEYVSNISTNAAQMRTILAPTAAPPTQTPPPGPTPSGKFEFFNVRLQQAASATDKVSFGYQLQWAVAPSEVQIGAAGTGARCDSMQFTTTWTPHDVDGVSGIVMGEQALALTMTTPGKCTFKTLQLMMYLKSEGPTKGLLYQQSFDIPFTLQNP